METVRSFLVCTLGSQVCDFPLAIVKRVLRAAAVRPLPQTPQGVLGVVDIAGQRIPVFTLRPRLGLSTRALDPNDRFVMTRTAQGPLIFIMDTVVEVRDYEPEKEIVPHPSIAKVKNCAGLEYMADGQILINDIDLIFSVEEQQLLLSARAVA